MFFRPYIVILSVNWYLLWYHCSQRCWFPGNLDITAQWDIISVPCDILYFFSPQFKDVGSSFLKLLAFF